MSRCDYLIKKILFILFFAIYLTKNVEASCERDKLTVIGNKSHWVFEVEVADNPVRRADGLMNRKFLDLKQGMVFIFEKPSKLVFWMKDTFIPLDIIFFDERGVIKSIHENAEPNSDKKIFGGSNLIGALEINGSLSSELGIEIGDVVQTIYLDKKKAILPC
tara:strand:+ start:87 stop:572 length:486 start_codon:yes stop_codon:yes gene_type:complete